jgi:hypothetical protein
MDSKEESLSDLISSLTSTMDEIKLASKFDTITTDADFGTSYHARYGAIPSLTTADISTLTIGNGGTGITGAQGSMIGGATVSPGYVYTTNTTMPLGNITYSNTSPWNTSAIAVNQSGGMELRGDNADIKINGKSMTAWMEKVEERLNILTPNPELEKEWDDLRRLGERYRKLEKKCKEKSQMWEALKKLPKVKV